MGKSGCSLIQGNIPAFACRDWGKPQRISVSQSPSLALNQTYLTYQARVSTTHQLSKTDKCKRLSDYKNKKNQTWWRAMSSPWCSVRGSFSSLRASCCSRCRSTCSNISSICVTKKRNMQSPISARHATCTPFLGHLYITPHDWNATSVHWWTDSWFT
jgi:hypothetical protein